jgi:hypothetical protein
LFVLDCAAVRALSVDVMQRRRDGVERPAIALHGVGDKPTDCSADEIARLG